jgi:hypothetical protein
VLSAFGVVDFLKALLVLLALFLPAGLREAAELRRNMPYQHHHHHRLVAGDLGGDGQHRHRGCWRRSCLRGADHLGPYGALALILLSPGS